MNLWVIVRTGKRGRNQLGVLHKNLRTEYVHLCGEHSSDVPDDMIVDWILDAGKLVLRAGDFLQLSNGTFLQISRVRGSA